MKAMLGLLNLKSGSVVIDGQEISKLSPQDRVKKGISFVPQTKNVFAELTVRENLEVGAFLREDDVNKVIEEIYNLFPILKEKSSQVVGQLSGGQRQRVAVARALVTDPDIILADEPTGNLDSETGAGIMTLLLELKQACRLTLIMATHDPQMACQTDRILRLSDGQIAPSLEES